MNTKTYTSAMRRRLPYIIVVTLLVAALSALGTYFLPEKKSVSLSIAVDVSDIQETSDYKFSRYYGTQASAEFAETVASWFQSPEVVQRIFQQAELDPGTTSLNKLAKIFDAEALAAQNVEVDFMVDSNENADKLLKAMGDMVSEKTSELNRSEDAVFLATIAKPIVVTREKNILINTLVGAIVGLILGIALAAFVEYWRETSVDKKDK